MKKISFYSLIIFGILAFIFDWILPLRIIVILNSLYVLYDVFKTIRNRLQ